MNEEEKEEIELDIEAKYVDKTEKEFLSRVTYAECIYILTPKNKYCDKIKELSVLKICEIIKNLQKENEELKEYLITQNCEINRLNLDKIRLELSQIPDTTEQYKYLKNEYKMRLERTDFENYKSNYILIKKVKDKIEELNNNRQYLSQFKDYKEKDYTNEEVINNCVEVLQELLESE